MVRPRLHARTDSKTSLLSSQRSTLRDGRTANYDAVQPPISEERDELSSLRTTIVCPTIHCPSCVTFISSLLESLDPPTNILKAHRRHQQHTPLHSRPSGPFLRDVSVSLLERTITFAHPATPYTASENARETTAAKHGGMSVVDRRYVIMLIRHVLAKLAEEGYISDTVVCTDRPGRGAVTQRQPAPTFWLDDLEILSSTSTEIPASWPPPADSQAGLSAISHSFADNLRSLIRPGHREERRREAKERENQARRKRHIEVCEACKNGSKYAETSSAVAVQSPTAPFQSDVAPPEQGQEPAEEPQGRWIVELAIGGMTCASCVGNVTSAARTLNSQDSSNAEAQPLISIDVNLLNASARAIVSKREAADQLVERIEDAGYEAEINDVFKEEGPDRNEVDMVRPRNGASQSLWRAKLAIGGMTCGSCVGNVKGAIQAISKEDSNAHEREIVSFDVDLLNGSASALLKRKESAEQVRDAIEDAGYTCEIIQVIQEDSPNGVNADGPEGQMRDVRIHLDGMFCHDCIVKVKTYLNAQREEHPSLQFVNSATFSLSRPTLQLSYVPNPAPIDGGDALTLRGLLSELTELDPAFTATYAPPPSLSSRSTLLAKRELRGLLARLAIAFIFAIPTLLLGVISPALLSTDNTLRKALDTPAWGAASRGEIALWLLATPVQFGVGALFYQRSWKSVRAVWRKGRSWTDRLCRWGDMNVLVALGTSVAYFSSLAFLFVDVTRSPSPSGQEVNMGMTYFDTCVFLIFFILLGRCLESWSKRKTGDAVTQLSSMKPATGILLLDPAQPATSRTETVPAELLEVGDLVWIPSGASPPLDGYFVATASVQEASFDEASLSGEARPASKHDGDLLYTGTVNVAPHPVLARVAVSSGRSMIDEILEVVREAGGRKASIERLADQITSYFVPAIVAVSILVFAVWLVVLYSGAVSEDWIGRHVPQASEKGARALFALEFAVSCLVIACPCGIGLAAPTAQVVGIGLASRRGILVNGGGEAFQLAARAARGKQRFVIVFDKTGTITQGGEGKVVDQSVLRTHEEDNSAHQIDNQALWRCVDLAEQGSTHPIGASLKAFSALQLKADCVATERTDEADIHLDDLQELAGKGLHAKLSLHRNGLPSQHVELFIGNRRLLDEACAPALDTGLAERVRTWQTAAHSVVFIAVRLPSSSDGDTETPGQLRAALAIADPVRSECAFVIEHLKKRYDAEVWMVSGDNEITADAVAREVGIDAHRVIAGVLPTGKRDWVDRLQQGGEVVTPSSPNAHSNGFARPHFSDRMDKAARPPVVLFVGDGINDSPALAQADVGLAMGGGSSIAHSSADFILLNRAHPLLSIPTVLSLSSATTFKIYSNFVWAGLFNIILVPVAAGALEPVNFRLGPSWSGLAMAFSSTSVVLNALALRIWRPPKDVENGRMLLENGEHRRLSHS